MVIGVFLTFKRVPNDLGRYETMMNTFSLNEQKALAVLHQDNDKRSRRRIAYELKYQGIPIWNKNLLLVNEADSLKIPGVLHQRNAKLKRYCLVRIQSYNVMYKYLDENKYKYEPEIQKYNEDLTVIINDIKNSSKLN
jgi:rhomboid protease GluP